MLGRQQVFLELEEGECDDTEDIADIMSNVHLNNNFLALAREVYTNVSQHVCVFGGGGGGEGREDMRLQLITKMVFFTHQFFVMTLYISA